MFAGVADTHAALWYLFGDLRMSAAARSYIDGAAKAGGPIAVSTITLAEIVYLIEKNRLPASAFDALKQALVDPDHVLKEAPFTFEVAEAMRRVARSAVPDMPDRIVAATAIRYGVPVISRDRRIRAANLQTVW